MDRNAQAPVAQAVDVAPEAAPELAQVIELRPRQAQPETEDQEDRLVLDRPLIEKQYRAPKAPAKPREISPPRSGLEKILDTFLDGKGRKNKHGNYYIDGNRLLYRNFIDHQERITPLALRVQKSATESLVIGNSSILQYVETSNAWGNTQLNRNQTKVQKLLETRVPMLPFGAFLEAKLDLKNIRILDQGKAETVTRTVEEYDHQARRNVKRSVKVHFTGSSLFEVDGKYFLFDIDRNEIAHGIFNPFIAEIPVKVKTVEAAYQALKPKEVLLAEKKGLKVLRQGEWFFIPCKAPKLKEQAKLKKQIAERQEELDKMGYTDWTRLEELQKHLSALQQNVPGPRALQAGRNRPNDCTMAVTVGKVTYCSGKVTHRGREHKELDLGKKWFIVVPNTATRSFQITGDVD